MRRTQSGSPFNRRPGILPGRRLWFALAIALVAAACSTATASADVPVVTATIYPGSGGRVSTRTVSSGALGQCPFAPVTQLTQPDGQTVDFPTTSWTVATVITCSLQVPIDGVTSVEVQRANGALEDPLSNADLVDPGRYQDPNSPEALPIISANGDSGQSYYNRPLRGPGIRTPTA